MNGWLVEQRAIDATNIYINSFRCFNFSIRSLCIWEFLRHLNWKHIIQIRKYHFVEKSTSTLVPILAHSTLSTLSNLCESKLPLLADTQMYKHVHKDINDHTILRRKFSIIFHFSFAMAIKRVRASMAPPTHWNNKYCFNCAIYLH